MSEDKYRILVTEDASLIRDVTCMTAEMRGYSADGASNGQEALNKLKDNSYDLILMDCQMPVIDGYEATRRLRAAGNNTPVIGVTANPLDEDRKEGLDSGMNQFLEKPLTPDKLEDLIKQYPAQ